MQVPFQKKLRIPFWFVDANGGVAKVDGVPTISASEGKVVETVAAKVKDDAGNEVDGFTTLVDPGAFIGEFKVAGVADVDLGSGAKDLNFDLGTHTALASPEATAAKVGAASIED